MADLVTLTQLHAFLNTPDTATANDTELQLFISAATAIIEDVTGPMTPQSFTETYDGGAPTIVLRHYPVISVASIVEYSGTTGQTLTAQTFVTQTGYDYLLDGTIGVLRRMSGGSPYLFASGTQNVQVTYTAGRSAVPPAVTIATLDLIRVFYQRTQLGGRPQGRPTGDESPGELVLGYLVPNFVMEALMPYKLAPKVA